LHFTQPTILPSAINCAVFFNNSSCSSFSYEIFCELGFYDTKIQKGYFKKNAIINYDGNLLSEHDLLASENIKKMNIISRILKSINYLIWGDV